MTAICVPIFVKPATDVEGAIAEAEEALAGLGEGPDSGMIELRCDTASVKEMMAGLEAARVPVIVTVRPTWEGGFSRKKDAERAELWEAAMEAGADYIDVELAAWEKSRAIREVVEDLAEKHGTRVIVSNHCFGGRPADLAARLERLLAVKSAAVLKLAWGAETILDGIEALRLTEQTRAVHRRELVALAMGEEGVISRLLAKKFGASFTFAAVGAGKESAPGQPTVEELIGTYRWKAQGAAMAVFGVVGWPVGHSLSPHIHNAGFDVVGFDGVYVPLAIRPEYEAFAGAVDALRACPAMKLEGLSVTIPHKENAFRYVAERGGEIEETAGRIGVVNTILWKAGSTGGSAAGTRALNSDYAGALDALAGAWNGQRAEVAGKKVAIMGAGGAARAIVAALAAHGAAVTIYNRTLEKAVALAEEFGTGGASVRAAAWSELSVSHADAYINCTPLGMFPKVNESPWDGFSEPNWSADTVVFDTVYNPQMTKLLKLARRKNARIVTGAEMFVRQAGIQFRAFTGEEPPMEVFRTVMGEALGK